MQSTKGYLIIEILIAIVILSTVLLALFSSISFTTRKTKKSRYENDAGLLVQEGLETSYNIFLSDWLAYGEGIYYPAPDALRGQWVLLSGEESGIQAMFTRKVEILKACRREDNGELIEIDEPGYPCFDGEVDKNSKVVRSTVFWTESGEERSVSSELLLIKT